MQKKMHSECGQSTLTPTQNISLIFKKKILTIYILTYFSRLICKSNIKRWYFNIILFKNNLIVYNLS